MSDLYCKPKLSIPRRALLSAAAAAAVSSVLPGRSLAADGKVALRIGYQKSSSIFIILKARGTLESLLGPKGVEVKWIEFTSGLPLLEGLNVGSLDFSADVADTVPLFAQAAGAQLTYVAAEGPSPAAQAIVVPETSPIRRVADLKGKRIALAKGAGVQYLVLKTLEQGGLKFQDIELAYLTPADARAAYERGSIDAWAIWDPFLAAAQQQAKARVLSDGKGIASYRRFYLAATPWAKRNDAVVKEVVQQLAKTGQWIKQNPAEAAAFHAPLVGLDATTMEIANGRRSYNVIPVAADALDEQQKIANAFTQAGLLPRQINVRELPVWS